MPHPSSSVTREWWATLGVRRHRPDGTQPSSPITPASPTVAQSTPGARPPSLAGRRGCAREDANLAGVISFREETRP